VTLLVIPAADLHPIGARAPELAAWLRGRVAGGDVVAQHGLVHRASGTPPWPRSALAAWQGGAAAEFSGLSREDAARRVATGRRLLCEIELDPRGFVAPGYAYTRALRAVLGESHEWFADLSAVRSRDGDVHARALCLGSSTMIKRTLLPPVIRAAARTTGEVMRVDIHPADFDQPSHIATLERVIEQAHRESRRGYEASKIVERYDEHVEDVLVNVFYALSLRALSRLDAEHGSVYAERAARTEAALLERCRDERTGLFFDLAGRGERRIEVSTWSSLAPLALIELPLDVRRRLVEEHLLDERRYLAPVGIPSVSQEEPSFEPGFSLWRCWRGPSWVNTAWLPVPAMWELGYGEEAERVVASLARAAARFGFREYYNPHTGRGLAARGFGFSTLLVDLLVQAQGEPSVRPPMMHP
jgi:predicted deacetylase